MKSIKRVLLTGMVLISCIFFSRSFSVQAAGVTYTASVPKEASAGVQIAVNILVSDNPGLTTLGLRLEYDEKILSYQKEKWTDDLNGGDNSLALVSDVTYAGKKVLNISMIDGSAYHEDGTIVTLYFKVLKAYSDCPVTLQLRDATDEDENPISGSTREVLSTESADVDNSNQDKIPDDNGSELKEDVTENEDSSSESITNMNQNAGSKKVGREEYDKSFKTGGFVWTSVLFGIWIVFMGIAVGCIIWQHRLKKHGKREIQHISGFKKD